MELDRWCREVIDELSPVSAGIASFLIGRVESGKKNLHRDCCERRVQQERLSRVRRGSSEPVDDLEDYSDDSNAVKVYSGVQRTNGSIDPAVVFTRWFKSQMGHAHSI